jgi:hypothetical protein
MRAGKEFELMIIELMPSTSNKNIAYGNYRQKNNFPFNLAINPPLVDLSMEFEDNLWI